MQLRSNQLRSIGTKFHALALNLERHCYILTTAQKCIAELNLFENRNLFDFRDIKMKTLYDTDYCNFVPHFVLCVVHIRKGEYVCGVGMHMIDGVLHSL